MDYSEYINKYKNIDKDILICACINALENNKGDNINIENYINKVLKQKQEYENGLLIANKLTEENNKNKYPNFNIKINTDFNSNFNMEGEFFYDSSINKLYITHNGNLCEITD